MTSDIIALSKGVRAALLSSQTVAAQQADTTARLASGLKVNNALDNPTNFFTSRSLDARATELNGILDGFGNARSQIQAAVDAQEKALELLDVMEAAREGGWQALKAGEYKDLTRRRTVVTGNSVIQSTTSAAITTGLAAETTVADKIAFLKTRNINDFHSRNANGQNFFISVGENEDFAQDRDQFAAGSMTYQQFIDRINTNLEGVSVDIIYDGDEAAPINDGLFKLQFQMEDEKDDRALYMTGWFNIFQNLNIDHGIYFSDDPDTEKTLLSFDTLPAGWETTNIPNFAPTWHTNPAPNGDGYPANTWVLNDGVNPDLIFTRGVDGTTLGDFVDYVNSEYAAGRFGLRMDQIDDASDPDDGKLRVATEGSSATRLLFKPRMSFVFQQLLIDANGNGSNGAFGINNTANPPAPGIPPATYDIDNTYWDQFETARTQIDDIIADGSFAGIALGKGEVTSIALNERGSRLTIRQQETSTQEIGIARALDYEFQMFDRLDVIENEVAEAREAVKSRLTQLQNELAIIQVREQFTKDLVNVLQAGSSKLTLADPDEEGAKLLASNTRQQLTGVALQLASQADRGVLSLF